MTSEAELPDFPGLGVTGSTGGLGGMVARELAALGSTQRLLVRDPARAPELDGATPAVCSYTDTAAARQALDGVKVLFMVSAAETQDRVQQHTAFIDAAAGAGVQHVVYTSFYGAAPDATFTLARDHYATEEHIRASGMDFTFLRDNLYLDFVPGFVGSDGVIRGPAGDGRVSAVSRDDVAAVAARVLTGSGFSGATYDLTGPRAFTLGEAAAVLTEAWGRKVRYEPETMDDAYRSRESYGAPAWEVAGWVTSYAAIASGELSHVSTAVRDITGQAPISLEEYVGRE